MTRTDEMNNCTRYVETMVARLGMKPLDIVYAKETEKTIDSFPEDIRRIHNIIPGQEYIYVWETQSGKLLKALNVTGDSTLYAIADLMWYIARDF